MVVEEAFLPRLLYDEINSVLPAGNAIWLISAKKRLSADRYSSKFSNDVIFVATL